MSDGTRVIEHGYHLFTAQMEGSRIRVSIPAGTPVDSQDAVRFIDLPLMGREAFSVTLANKVLEEDE